MLIGERIRYLRKKVLVTQILNNVADRFLTQDEFGKQLKISGANLGNIETGRVNATDRLLEDICTVFPINKTWLLNETGEPLKEMLPEDEYSKAAASIVAENDSFGMEIVKTYFSMDAASKAALKNFIIQLASNIQKKEDDEI